MLRTDGDSRKENKQQPDFRPGECLLSKCSYEQGGGGVSARTLGITVIPRCRNQGMPEGRGSRKLTSIIDAARAESSQR